MNERSRRSGSGRLPGEQTRARALHRIGLSQGQSSGTQTPAMPKSFESVPERRRRKVDGFSKGAKPAPSLREQTRIAKMPVRKPMATADGPGTARNNSDKEGPPLSGSGTSPQTPRTPRTPQTPRTPGGQRQRPQRRGEPESDVRKRALALLATSKSAAVKQRTESFMQKHKIVLETPTDQAHAKAPAEAPAEGPAEGQALCDAPAPMQDSGTACPQLSQPEPAETVELGCAGLDTLSFAWLRSAFHWCIQCFLGCVLLSLRCCFGGMHCLKPLMAEEVPRRRFQDKPAARTALLVVLLSTKSIHGIPVMRSRAGGRLHEHDLCSMTLAYV